MMWEPKLFHCPTQKEGTRFEQKAIPWNIDALGDLIHERLEIKLRIARLELRLHSATRRQCPTADDGRQSQINSSRRPRFGSHIIRGLPPA